MAGAFVSLVKILVCVCYHTLYGHIPSPAEFERGCVCAIGFLLIEPFEHEHPLGRVEEPNTGIKVTLKYM